MTALEAVLPFAPAAEDLAAAVSSLRFDADRAARYAVHDRRHQEWADRCARALAAVEWLAAEAGLVEVEEGT